MSAPTADDAPSPAPTDPRLAAIEKLRGTSRWMMVAFAAIGSVLAGTAPLSNVGRLDQGSGRWWVAGVAAAVALAAIAAAIWAAAFVLVPVTRGISDFAANAKVQSIFSQNFELLDGLGKDLASFKTRYDAARDEWLAAGVRQFDTPNRDNEAAERAAHLRHRQFAPAVQRIMSEGLLVTVRSRFHWAQGAMVVAALIGGSAIVAFAWAANPAAAPARTTTTVAVPSLGIGPEVGGAGVTISGSDAANLLRTHGIKQAEVESYVLSFSGPISIETLAARKRLLRYSAAARGTGRFLTSTRFASAQIAQVALHLSWSNTAKCLQHVRVTKRTVVLVGGIAFGKPGVKQFVILDPTAFTFPKGTCSQE